LFHRCPVISVSPVISLLECSRSIIDNGYFLIGDSRNYPKERGV
jgi:hypothetical protein